MQKMLNNYEKDLQRALRVNPVPNKLYPCDSLVVKFQTINNNIVGLNIPLILTYFVVRWVGLVLRFLTI